MINKRKPELLAPAGDLEKLKVAVKYGADAVYLGGNSLGLRAKAKNFQDTEMKEGIAFAHAHGAKVFVTVNIFAHNQDFDGIEEYLLSLQQMGADAIIVSDPGIFSVAREVVPEMEIHISTQSNTTNLRSIKFWKSLGASRIVLARELSLEEIKQIKESLADCEIEAFVHGAMCMAYSGRCLLSNFLTERDANRGGCSQPCRWKYNLVEANRHDEQFPIIEDEGGTFILNSKDLCMIEHMPDLFASGIDSFKIEGRMKTAYYVGTVVKAYREAIDDYHKDPKLYEEKLKNSYYLQEVEKSSHRKFTTGFFYERGGKDAQNYESSSYVREFDFVGIVKGYDKERGLALVEQRNRFCVGDKVEVLSPTVEGFKEIEITEMYNEFMTPVTSAPHAAQILWVKVDCELAEFSMLRKCVAVS